MRHWGCQLGMSGNWLIAHHHRHGQSLLEVSPGKLYPGSYFYHAGDITTAEAPSEVLEERLADAGETVLQNRSGLKVMTNFSRRTGRMTIQSRLRNQVKNSRC